MILTLFVIGIFAIAFAIHNLIKKKNILAVFFFFMGIILLAIGSIVVYLQPQTLPEFIRKFFNGN
jgi:hypothetical protein